MILKTARAHYEGLLNEARKGNGPVSHTYASVPGEWSGRYAWAFQEMAFGSWFGMQANQVPTILSALTDEYQTRAVQQIYHYAVNDAPQRPASYCWPEGFMRRYHFTSTRERQILVTPQLVPILASSADNFITNVHIDRTFNTDGAVPRLGADVPRWYGETIGFWDHDALITWTSNIQGWAAHGTFEFSNAMQTIEIYAPIRAPDGALLGLNDETVFYDKEALVEPIRIVRDYWKLSPVTEGEPVTYVECIPLTFPLEGVATPVSPGTVIQYEVPDMYGRTWAAIWEKYWEIGMKRSEQVEDIFVFD